MLADNSIKQLSLADMVTLTYLRQRVKPSCRADKRGANYWFNVIVMGLLHCFQGAGRWLFQVKVTFDNIFYVSSVWLLKNLNASQTGTATNLH